MAVNQDTVIKIALSENDLSSCIDNTQILCETISDRSDLHLRSYMERYIDIMMGEVAEAAVIKWLKQNGKYAVSAVNKSSGKPDSGRDIILRGKHKQEIECSVKSSLSVYKDNINDILDTFTIATKASELRKVNIQVYYWLKLKGENRITVPSNKNMAIIGWIGENDVKEFGTYNTENRQVAKIKLRNIRTMKSLLDYLE
ncbi:MAG: hypothetical protein HFI01_03275 [Lachnospiraceae bacterium]|nr:hypothetical protein [Lachnospiraceae bacterium]MCI9341996.1 hypothetical protein [Lachnospiraceae bacterium]GFH91515.1 hypothetical protein IMSAGC002_02772 [Lachnospiraceae bacterium]